MNIEELLKKIIDGTLLESFNNLEEIEEPNEEESEVLVEEDTADSSINENEEYGEDKPKERSVIKSEEEKEIENIKNEDAKDTLETKIEENRKEEREKKITPPTKPDINHQRTKKIVHLGLSPSKQIKEFFGEEKRYFLQLGFLWSELFGPPVGLREHYTYEGNFFWNF